MKIVVAADHAGYPLKQMILTDLKVAHHETVDLGTFHPEENDDYPDFAALACEAVHLGKADRAIILCGSGVGACVTANKFPGIRAGLCHDHYSAHQGVEHDNMNVLCMGARVVGQEVAREIVLAFTTAKFSGETHHVRRLKKLKTIEQRFLRGI